MAAYTPILTLSARISRACERERQEIARRRGSGMARAYEPIPGVASIWGYDDGLGTVVATIVDVAGRVRGSIWRDAPSA